jgi:hypothetical protein
MKESISSSMVTQIASAIDLFNYRGRGADTSVRFEMRGVAHTGTDVQTSGDLVNLKEHTRRATVLSWKFDSAGHLVRVEVQSPDLN